MDDQPHKHSGSHPEQDNLRVEVTDTLESVAAAQWNGLDGQGFPFVRYEFLHALEDTGCLGEKNGWFPRYFLVYSEDQLIAACPTYVKTNSYGEFVFDWSWAEAYEQNGLNYYPKLVSCIPYTPATGPRFLIHPDHDARSLILALHRTIIAFCDEQKYSSVHWLFTTKQESDWLAESGLMTRIDCQYHWQNHQYQTFEDFLANCTSKRRKTIRRERRFVTDANLRLERRSGDTLTPTEWDLVHNFYSSTFDRKWGSASLTCPFFHRIGQTMGDQVLIVFAYRPDYETPIACSIMFTGQHRLYGRFWGASENHHCLHFEACYYQGIEHAIALGLEYFEPGAQGEHKIPRGFEPTVTQSSHWIAHDGFRKAIDQYLENETLYVMQRCEGLSNLLPFKDSLEIDSPES